MSGVFSNTMSTPSASPYGEATEHQMLAVQASPLLQLLSPPREGAQLKARQGGCDGMGGLCDNTVKDFAAHAGVAAKGMMRLLLGAGSDFKSQEGRVQANAGPLEGFLVHTTSCRA